MGQITKPPNCVFFLILTILLIRPAGSRADPINSFDANRPLRIGLTAVIVQDFLQINKQLLHYIEEKANISVELVLKTTYQEMNDLLEKGAVDIAFVCSPPYIIGHGKFGLELLVAPQIDGKPFYHSYVIVSADSKISKFEDLRGKIYAFSDPLSNSGKLVPTYVLARMGETPDTFFKRYIYTYSHYNSIEAVAVGLVDGASVDGYVWELANAIDPKFTSKTKVIEKSFPCPITPFVVRKGIDSKLKDKITSIMLGMHEDKKGREILDRLKIDKFVIVSDDFYNPIREMMEFVERHE